MAGIQDVAPFDRVKDVDVIMTVIKPQPIIGLGNILILKAMDGSKPDNQQTQPTQSTQQTQPTNAGGSSAGSSDDKSKEDADTKKLLNEVSNPTPAITGLSDTLLPADVENGVLLRKTDPVTGAQYTEYQTADSVGNYEDKKGNVYKKAVNYFMQDAASDRIAVLSYPKGQLADALKAFWYNNWTFMVFADPQLENNTISDDAYIASNICEANRDHFLVLQADQPAVFTQFYAQNYTIGLVHDMSEYMDTALIGSTATLTVGSVTWKFRKLKGITAEKLTVQQKKAIDRVHAIAYIEVSGQGETSEGWVLSGDYIDSLHGDLWVKTNMGSKLEKYLQDTDKVPYDQRGINALSAIATQVLQQAGEQGIILLNDDSGKYEYKVTASPRSAQSQKDLSARHYGGLTFWYHRSGAIHTVTVHGTVQSDTFTNSKY